MTHICVIKLTIIGSDNSLSPGRRQAIIWTNAGLLLIGPLGTNFSEILIEILTFSFNKMRLKVSSAKRWPFCLGLNVLMRRHDNNVVIACVVSPYELVAQIYIINYRYLWHLTLGCHNLPRKIFFPRTGESKILPIIGGCPTAPLMGKRRLHRPIEYAHYFPFVYVSSFMVVLQILTPWNSS